MLSEATLPEYLPLGHTKASRHRGNIMSQAFVSPLGLYSGMSLSKPYDKCTFVCYLYGMFMLLNTCTCSGKIASQRRYKPIIIVAYLLEIKVIANMSCCKILCIILLYI